MTTPSTHPTATDPGARTTLDRVLVGVAVVLHLGIAVFPLAASGLLAPPWFLVVLAVAWLAAAVLLRRTGRTRPRLAWLVPVGLVAGWAVAITLGDVLLGWTA